MTMLAQFMPAKKTPIAENGAVSGFRQGALQRWGTAKPETVATLAAQWALESGRGAAMFNFNPSNIKASVHYRGFYTCFPLLNEVLVRNGKRETVWFTDRAELVSKNGEPAPGKTIYEVPEGHPQSRFRAFETFGEGVADKLSFLDRVGYANAKRAALDGDPVAYVAACHAAGYFTADLKPYTRGVASLFKTYLPLARREELEPVALEPEEEDQLCRDMAQCMRTPIPDWLRARVEALQIPYWDLIDLSVGGNRDPEPLA